MTWNYRIVKVADSLYTESNGFKYGLCEVYYNDDKLPYMRTADSMIEWYESKEELIGDIKLMYNDVLKDQPILTDEDLIGDSPLG